MKNVVKKNLGEYIKEYSPYIATANAYAEPYLLLKKKCQEKGLKITRVTAALFKMFVEGEVDFIE